MNHPRPPYTGQGGYGPNSPMIKKEIPYFASSPLGGHSPGPGRPMQQQQTTQQGPGSSSSSSASSLPNPAQLVPGAKSSPVPMSQNSPMGPPTPQQIQQQQQQQQQFNARKAPTPTSNNNVTTGRTPPPTGNNPGQQQQQTSGINVQFNQTQQQQMQMNMTANNGQQIQVILTALVAVFQLAPLTISTETRWSHFVVFVFFSLMYFLKLCWFVSPLLWKHYRGKQGIKVIWLLSLCVFVCVCMSARE